MKKMGRPTQNPRTIHLNLRLSEKEAADIQKCAEALNANRINAVLAGIELLKEKLNISE